jgi:hypothetical protein
VNTEQLLYLLGTIVAAVGSYAVAKLGARATASKVVADKEIGAGQLALDIATRLDREVTDLRRWKNAIQRWWPQHVEWDEKVSDELMRLDPGAYRRVGHPPSLPEDVVDDHHAEVAHRRQDHP